LPSFRGDAGDGHLNIFQSRTTAASENSNFGLLDERGQT
jgi:hypothetical protein